MIKAIIFDFYGVICSEIGSHWYKTRAPQELVPELMRMYDCPSDLGTLSEEEFFEGIGRSVHASGVETRKEWFRAAVIDEGTVSLIQELKDEYRLAICSNGSSRMFRDILNTTNITDAFHTIVCSSEVGMAKPNHDMYLLTLERLGVRAEEAVFIDDRAVNIEGAEAVGIKGLLYTDASTLRKDLQSLLN